MQVSGEAAHSVRGLRLHQTTFCACFAYAHVAAKRYLAFVILSRLIVCWIECSERINFRQMFAIFIIIIFHNLTAFDCHYPI